MKNKKKTILAIGISCIALIAFLCISLGNQVNKSIEQPESEDVVIEPKVITTAIKTFPGYTNWRTLSIDDEIIDSNIITVNCTIIVLLKYPDIKKPIYLEKAQHGGCYMFRYFDKNTAKQVISHYFEIRQNNIQPQMSEMLEHTMEVKPYGGNHIITIQATIKIIN